jgi:hypothetical protein
VEIAIQARFIGKSSGISLTRKAQLADLEIPND